MNIEMRRGDRMPVRFLVTDRSGKVEAIDFDEIYFTVKKNPYTSEVLIQKRLSNGTIAKDEGGIYYKFAIEPNDTDGLDYGKYDYDIEVIFEQEIKHTIVGKLNILPEVTFASNEGGEEE